MKKPFLQISDHALLRYLARVQGVDIEAIRMGLAHKLDACVPEEMQDGICGIQHEGFTYKLKSGVVTTVLTSEARPRGQRGPKRKGVRKS